MVKSEYNYISWKQFINFLNKKYWLKIINQRGSHIKILLLSNNKKTIIPNHKIIAYWTFSSILKQLEIDEKLFLDYINN